MSFDGNFGNPASRSHSFGWKADEAVEEARNNLATLIGCDPREIIWTSGATESDNLAIKGAARFYKNKGNHLVTSKIEHKAVLDPFRQLEEEGFEVTYLEPNSSGEIGMSQRPGDRCTTSSKPAALPMPIVCEPNAAMISPLRWRETSSRCATKLGSHNPATIMQPSFSSSCCASASGFPGANPCKACVQVSFMCIG